MSILNIYNILHTNGNSILIPHKERRTVSECIISFISFFTKNVRKRISRYEAKQHVQINSYYKEEYSTSVIRYKVVFLRTQKFRIILFMFDYVDYFSICSVEEQ